MGNIKKSADDAFELEDFGFYTPWASSQYDKGIEEVSFPDFEEAKSIFIHPDISYHERRAIIKNSFHSLIFSRMQDKLTLDKPKSEQDLKKSHPNSDLLKMRLNVWDVLNRVHPPEQMCLLPSVQDVLLLNAKNIPKKENADLDLNFWITIHELSDSEQAVHDTSKQYHVYFPEIDEDAERHCLIRTDGSLGELYEKIELDLVDALKDYVFYNRHMPKKWQQEKTEKWHGDPVSKSYIGDQDEALLKYKMHVDNYIDVLSYLQNFSIRSMTKNSSSKDIIQRWPPKKPIRRWPPEDPPKGP